MSGAHCREDANALQSKPFFKDRNCRHICSAGYEVTVYYVCRLFRNTEELEKLSELGVLFLLFEMGLELSLDRLKVLHKPKSTSVVG